MSRFSAKPKFVRQAYRPAAQSLHQQKYERLQISILSGEPCHEAHIDDNCHDIDVLYSVANDLDRENPMREPEPKPAFEPEEHELEQPAEYDGDAEPEAPAPEPEPIRPFTPEPEPRSPRAPPPTPVKRSRSMFDVLVQMRKKAVRDAVLASLPDPAHTV